MRYALNNFNLIFTRKQQSKNHNNQSLIGRSESHTESSTDLTSMTSLRRPAFAAHDAQFGASGRRHLASDRLHVAVIHVREHDALTDGAL